MASFIAFSTDDDWFTSNFIFRLFLESCASRCDAGAAMRELDKAHVTQYLYLHKLDPELAHKLFTLMRRMAHTILEATDDQLAERGAALDSEGQRMYLEEVQRLQEKLDWWASRYDSQSTSNG